jgi:hypothetical protein
VARYVTSSSIRPIEAVRSEWGGLIKLVPEKRNCTPAQISLLQGGNGLHVDSSGVTRLFFNGVPGGTIERDQIGVPEWRAC